MPSFRTADALFYGVAADRAPLRLVHKERSFLSSLFLFRFYPISGLTERESGLSIALGNKMR